MKPGTAEARNFRYEGYDVITMEKLVERDYAMPEPQTAQEVISFYAKRIAQEVKLPSQFAASAPKVREFLATRAFGKPVELEGKAMIQAISSNVAQFVTVDLFVKALRKLVVEEQQPQLVASRRLSETPAFPYSRPHAFAASKTVFNLAACDNDFEERFARFLQAADDVAAFAKLPSQFGFAIEYTDSAASLRYYEPDFVAVLDGRLPAPLDRDQGTGGSGRGPQGPGRPALVRERDPAHRAGVAVSEGATDGLRQAPADDLRRSSGVRDGIRRTAITAGAHAGSASPRRRMTSTRLASAPCATVSPSPPPSGSAWLKRSWERVVARPRECRSLDGLVRYFRRLRAMAAARESGWLTAPADSRLVTVCRLLNASGVRYAIVGGFALALHGAVRATKDVDVLIEPTLDNVRRALDALAGLTYGIGELIRRRSSRSPSPSSATIRGWTC